MALTSAITDRALDVGAAVASVNDPRCGAVAAFVGAVRIEPAAQAQSGKEVDALEYEAHPTLAEERLGTITETATAKWGLVHATILHRTGRCALGEPTVVVACSAPHRAHALEACRWMIDELKATVPIWKKELYSDGSEWVGDNRS